MSVIDSGNGEWEGSEKCVGAGSTNSNLSNEEWMILDIMTIKKSNQTNGYNWKLRSSY